MAGVLVTGAAGFLGMHVASTLLLRGLPVYGVDNLSPAYNPALKQARLRELERHAGFRFARADLADDAAVATLAGEIGGELTGVAHLAVDDGAGPGPGTGPDPLTRALAVHLAVLELCRQRLPDLRHLVYAGPTPSGATPDEAGAVAARARELVSLAYARLHGLPQTRLDLPDLYGPWGRPDAAYHVLADAVAADRVLDRTGTPLALAYVEDVAAAVAAALDRPPDAGEGRIPHGAYTLAAPGRVDPRRLARLLAAAVGCGEPARDGDGATPSTLEEGAPEDDAAFRDLGWRPTTGLEEGLRRFAAWHKAWYRPG